MWGVGRGEGGGGRVKGGAEGVNNRNKRNHNKDENYIKPLNLTEIKRIKRSKRLDMGVF